MDANFVTETLFWLVTFIMGTLMTIVGFLVKHSITKNEKEMMSMKMDIDKNRDTFDNKLANMLTKLDNSITTVDSSVRSLNLIVSEIKEVILVVKTEHGEQIKEIRRRIDNKMKWLEEHDIKFEKHGERIKEVESACKYNHK